MATVVRGLEFYWPALGVSVRARLEDGRNQLLCDDVWEALPFVSLQNQAALTGGSMYLWVPTLSFAKIDYFERIDEAPIGRIRYSQNTGNKIALQYDDCSEDIFSPVLGEVLAEDLESLTIVGAAAKDALLMSKRPLWVEVRGIDLSTGGLEPNPRIKPGEEELRKTLLDRYQNGDSSVGVRALVEEILTEAANAFLYEPEELLQVRTGRSVDASIVPHYFGPWEFTYSMLRDYSMYTLYPIAKLCRDEEMSDLTLKKIVSAFDPTYSNFLGNNGLRRLQGFAKHTRELLANSEVTRTEMTSMIDSLCLYSNALSAWAYFYYPWECGFLFRSDTNRTLEAQSY